MTTAFDAASDYVASLEAEAADDPKAFYGNKAVPATGHERIASALRAVRGIKQRLEAIDRGK